MFYVYLGVPVIRLDDERYGLERLNLDDNVLQGSESPTKSPGTKTRPNTDMNRKTPEKSAKWVTLLSDQNVFLC